MKTKSRVQKNEKVWAQGLKFGNYIVAQVGRELFCAIDMVGGNRWAEPVKLPSHQTRGQLESILPAGKEITEGLNKIFGEKEETVLAIYLKSGSIFKFIKDGCIFMMTDEKYKGKSKLDRVIVGLSEEVAGVIRGIKNCEEVIILRNPTLTVD